MRKLKEASYNVPIRKTRDGEEVKFEMIDDKNNLINVEVERTNRNGYPEFTMSGDISGSGAGQIFDSVKPASKAQEKLIQFWEDNHLEEISERQWEDVLSIIEIIIGDEEKNKQDFSVSWESIGDDYIEALGKVLELSPKQAEEMIEGSGTSYEVGSDGYYTVGTEDEVYDLAVERTEDLIADIGIGGLNINLESYVDEEWFEDYQRESNASYVNDIDSESSSGNFENRLIDELVDEGILDEENDFDEDEATGELNLKDSVDLDQAKEDYVDKRIDGSGYSSAIDWYISEFGEEDFNQVIIDRNLVNLTEVAEYVVGMDGVASILNGYDGREETETVNGTDYYIYRS